MSIKKLVKCIVITIAVIVILPIVFLLCFGMDWHRPLQNGYSLCRSSSQVISVINEEDDLIISPNVDGYAEYPSLIVGHVSTNSDFASSRKGYFYINTKNESVQKGLNKRYWLTCLRKYGIKEQPVLRRPTRW